jgi:hypothetical protein
MPLFCSLPVFMLSLDELRGLIGRSDLSDEYLYVLRDDLYWFARVMIEGYLWEKRQARQRRQTLRGVELDKPPCEEKLPASAPTDGADAGHLRAP